MLVAYNANVFEIVEAIEPLFIACRREESPLDRLLLEELDKEELATYNLLEVLLSVSSNVKEV